MVTVEFRPDLDHGSEQAAYRESGADAFLAGPFLRVVGEPGSRRLLTGRVRVAVTADRPVAVSVVLQCAWAEAGGWHQERDPASEPDADLLAALAEPAHQITGDDGVRALTIGKAFAEQSRNAVLQLRALRYDAERQLADLLAQRSSRMIRPLLAEIVELSMAVGRARDQAHEAFRDGMWIWLWDADTYRRNRGEETHAPEAPWEALHRAALRHCEAMDAQLAEETARLHSLLSSMSTLAVAQDGEAQQRFNLAAGVVAAGLGVPALILSLYGADSFLPLDSFDHAWRALLPIGLTTLVTAGVVLNRASARPRHHAMAALLVAALVGALLFAGLLAPG